MPSNSERPDENQAGGEERETAPHPSRRAEPEGTPRRREREPLPQFDWLTEVAIPICVFGLLSSLLYYLIEVRTTLGGAATVGPLRWVVFWFLLACVGIARLRAKYASEMAAGMYSVLLAGAMAAFVWAYTGVAGTFHGSAEVSRTFALIFNWALVAVVWWAASAVTREATLEENVESQLEGGLWTLVADQWQEPSTEDRTRVRPRHPGRLVLWVSLAALVLFAVGQRSIGDQGRHAEIAFLCMSSYVLFALMLLALTNLSALRMQVRRRGISLAPAITPAWIVASAIVVVAIVFFSFSLAPRFGTEAADRVAALPEWISETHERGLDEGPAQGLGPEGHAPPEEGQTGAGDAQGTDQTAGGDEEGSGAAEGDGTEDDDGTSGEGETTETGDDDGLGSGDCECDCEGECEGAGAGQGAEDTGDDGEDGEDGDEPAAAPTHPETPEATSLLLWLLLIAAALAVAYFLWRYRRELFEVARRIGREAARIPALVGAAVIRAWHRVLALLATLGLPARAKRPRNLPDDPFVDIFARGFSDQLEPAEVVRYVYRAFQVYAARSGYQRREDQTALEFLRSLPAKLLLPDRAAERLTRAYVLATYSPREVTERDVAGARDTWAMMRDRLETTGRANPAD